MKGITKKIKKGTGNRTQNFLMRKSNPEQSGCSRNCLSTKVFIRLVFPKKKIKTGKGKTGKGKGKEKGQRERKTALYFSLLAPSFFFFFCCELTFFLFSWFVISSNLLMGHQPRVVSACNHIHQGFLQRVRKSV